MKEKWVYIALGLMTGVMAVFFIGQDSGKEAFAQTAAPSIEAMRGEGMIALTSPAPGNANKLLLWLIDTRDRKMLLYEYVTDTSLTLKAVRDIQYDMDIPDGVALMMGDKRMANRPNLDEIRNGIVVKKWYESIRKAIKDEETRE